MRAHGRLDEAKLVLTSAAMDFSERLCVPPPLTHLQHKLASTLSGRFAPL